MASKIKEIIECGKPPGYGGRTKDPQSPDVAIPRALKAMEQTQPARDIARGAGWSVETLKRTWKI